jgi:transcriptional regulator with XRE-family HTH domain
MVIGERLKDLREQKKLSQGPRIGNSDVPAFHR